MNQPKQDANTGDFNYLPDGDGRIRRNRQAYHILGHSLSSYKSYSEIVEDFRIIRFRDVIELERIKSKQELDQEIKWMIPSEKPLLVIFISHRWEGKDFPDPFNRQISVLKSFINLFIDIAIASRKPHEKRISIIPTLKKHGTLQAAYFVGEIADFLKDYTGNDDELKNILLNRVGIWYDFMSLPQKERTPDEEIELKNALLNLIRFVGSGSTLILRDANDGYDNRGWCAIEFWSAAGYCIPWQHTVVILRIDLFGDDINQSKEMTELAPPESYNTYSDFLNIRRALYKWQNDDAAKAIDITESIKNHYFLAFSWKEKKLAVPQLCKPDFRPGDEPNIDKTPASYQFWYAIRELLYLKGLKDTDFDDIIRKYMKTYRIECTEDYDIVPVGLWLLGCHAPLSEYGFITFIGRCMLRYLSKEKDLRVRVFEKFPNQLIHYQFSDGEESVE